MPGGISEEKFKWFASKMKRIIVGAMKELQDQTPLRAVMEAIGKRDFVALMTAIPWTSLNGNLNPVKGVVLDVIRHEADRLASKDAVSFDITNPRVYEWIDDHGTKLVKEVTENTKEAIKKAVTYAYDKGKGPRVIADEIISHIGLLPNQVAAAENYRADLEKQGMAPAKIDKTVQLYEYRLLQYRANTIARTETINAAAAGQQFYWDSAVKDGLLDKAAFVVEWSTAVNDACSKCIDMDGMIREIDGVYSNGVERPTRHPNCRCVENVIERETAGPAKTFTPGAPGQQNMVSAKPKGDTELLKKLKKNNNLSDHRQTVISWMNDNINQGVNVIKTEGMASEVRMKSVTFDGINYHFDESQIIKEGHPVVETLLNSIKIKRIPTKLKQRTKDIYFTAQKNDYDDYWATEYNLPGFESHAAASIDGKVTVFRSKALSVNDMAHEMSHSYEPYIPFTQLTEYENMISSGEQSLTSYGRASPSEDIAEHIAIYCEGSTARKRLKKNAPLRYRIIHELMMD